MQFQVKRADNKLEKRFGSHIRNSIPQPNNPWLTTIRLMGSLTSLSKTLQTISLMHRQSAQHLLVDNFWTALTTFLGRTVPTFIQTTVRWLRQRQKVYVCYTTWSANILPNRRGERKKEKQNQLVFCIFVVLDTTFWTKPCTFILGLWYHCLTWSIFTVVFEMWEAWGINETGENMMILQRELVLLWKLVSNSSLALGKHFQHTFITMLIFKGNLSHV